MSNNRSHSKLVLIWLFSVFLLLSFVPVHSQSGLTFDVARQGTSNTYHAISRTTSASYSGSLKSVVENAVSEIMGLGGGGEIIFTAGNFDLGTEYFKFYDPHHITFAGQGIDVTFLLNSTNSASDTEPFNCSNCDFLTIRDMTISAGGPDRTTSDALDFDNGDGNLIERIKVTDSRGRGIVFDGKDAGGSAQNNVVRDCIINGPMPLDGIQFLASGNNLVEGCQITGMGRHGIYAAMASSSASQPFKPSDGNIIIGNTVQLSASNGIAANGSNQNVISGNTILNNINSGVLITTGSSRPCNDNVVEFNTATANNIYGLNITSALCNRTVVRSNNFAGNAVGPIRDLGTGTIYINGGTPTNTPGTPATPTNTLTPTPITPTFTLTPSPTTTPVGGIVTVIATADSYVSDSSPASNYGTSTSLRTDASPIQRSYLRFQVPTLTGSVISATVRVFASTASSIGYTVHGTVGGWGETTINFNTAPSFGTNVGSSGSFSAGSWTQVDVTALVAGGGEYNFVLITTSNTATSYSSRQGGNPPQLVLNVATGSLPSPTPSHTPTETLTPSATFTSSPTPELSLTPSNTPVSDGTITLNSAADSYISDASPSTNYGNSATLRTDNSPVIRSYLRFQVPTLSGSVVSATLRVFATSASSIGYTVHGTDGTWGELTVNFNNAPSFGSSIGSSGSISASSWTQVDVTALVTGEGEYNFVLASTSNTATSFSSRQSATNQPQLIVNTTSGGLLPVALPPPDILNGVPLSTETPTVAPVPPTETPLPPTETATETSMPPSATATETPLPPTETATETPLPPTETATETPLPPTETATETPLPPTETATETPLPPTATPSA